MAEARVPAWFTAVGSKAAAERVYEMFREVLRHLPMSSTELAGALGVSQPTVSRWANDSAHPSLEEMTAALKVVTQRLHETEIVVARSAGNIALVVEAVRLNQSSTLDRKTQDGRSLAETRDRLAELLRTSLNEELALDGQPVLCCAAFPCIFGSQLDIYPKRAS